MFTNDIEITTLINYIN